jgi:hypothetical protein
VVGVLKIWGTYGDFLMTETALVEKRREQSRFVPSLENLTLGSPQLHSRSAIGYAQAHERSARLHVFPSVI